MTPSSPRASCAALVAFASLVFASSALAELPHHLQVQTLDPDPSLVTTESGELADLHYGQAVAIRNGLAFVGMPLATPGRVDVWSQTATGWVRTQTIESPDSAPPAEFGRAVTFRDGTVVVGSASAAYVYRRVNGVWRLKQTLAPPAMDNIAEFSTSMWHEAGVLVVGARTTRGSVYVFETDPAGKFVQRAHLEPSDGYYHDAFGVSVTTTRGRTIVVGAPGSENENPPGDAAYVFQRNAADQWVQTQKLVPPSDGHGRFGSAVAMDKGMILVGAPLADAEGGPFGPTEDGHMAEGSAYGYLPSAGNYVESFKLRPRSDELFSYSGFGGRIAMFNERIAVTADGESPFGDHAPPAYILTYSRDGNVVTPLGLAKPGEETQSTSIWIANNWLLVGSPFRTCTSNGCVGQANVFDLVRFAQ